MTINTIADHVLEEIELRLIGADHRPWGVTPPDSVDHAGRQFIGKTTRKAIKKALRAAGQSAIASGGSPAAFEVPPERQLDDVKVDAAVLRQRLALFYAGEDTTNEMLTFVAHAPEDVERLLNEVKSLKHMLGLAVESRDKAVKELQALKVDCSRAEEKVSDVRRAWKTLVKEMKS